MEKLTVPSSAIKYAIENAGAGVLSKIQNRIAIVDSQFEWNLQESIDLFDQGIKLSMSTQEALSHVAQAGGHTPEDTALAYMAACLLLRHVDIADSRDSTACMSLNKVCLSFARSAMTLGADASIAALELLSWWAKKNKTSYDERLLFANGGDVFSSLSTIVLGIFLTNTAYENCGAAIRSETKRQVKKQLIKDESDVERQGAGVLSEYMDDSSWGEFMTLWRATMNRRAGLAGQMEYVDSLIKPNSQQ